MKYLIIAFLIVSCQGVYKNKDMKMFNNTNEFSEMQDSVKVSLSEAKELFERYHSENKFKKLETVFYYFQDGYYFFGYHTDPLRDKENKVWYFIEAKISSETGDLVPLDEPIDWKEDKARE